MSEPARSWWSGQFAAMLENLGMGPELARGRRYARAGRVRQLTISASLATALVSGGGPDVTYRARIAIRAFSGADWARVERALAGQALYAAKLLAGELPDDIGRVFDGYGLRLFPDRPADVAMDCTCPDWQVPCQHLAAVCYALAESFDTDPFGVLAWRGRTRDELLGRLRALRGQRRPDGAGSSAPRPARAEPPLDPATFWTSGGLPALTRVPVTGGVHPPDALLDQLDPLDLTVGRHEAGDLLRPAYRALPGEG